MSKDTVATAQRCHRTDSNRRFQALPWLLALLLSPLTGQSQADTNSFAWARRGGGPAADMAAGVSVDASTNAIIVGSFSGTASFGDAQITAKGATDLFVAKYQGDGSLAWVQGWGGTQEDAAAGVATETNGYAVVVGYYRGAASFGSLTLPILGGNSLNGFILRVGPGGTPQWVAGIASAGDDRASAVAVDQEGNSYVTGTFMGTIQFGSGVSITSLNAVVPEAYLASYTPSGATRWARRIGATRGAVGYAVTTDASGHVFVAGEFLGTGSFDGVVLTSGGDRDSFAAKYSSGSGDRLWAVRHGLGAADGTRAAITDSQGNLILGGYFNGSIDFGPQTLSAQGRKDFFIAKLNPEGQLIWARAGGGLQDDNLLGVTVSSLGGVTAVGNFSGSLQVGSLQVAATGGASDAFLLRLDPDGTPRSLVRAGSPGNGVDSANAVAIDLRGHTFVAGEFSDTATFGAHTLTTGNLTNRDAFLVRRVTIPPTIAAAPQPTNVLLGAGFTLQVGVGGEGPFAYQWLKNGLPVPGETNAVLLRTNTVATDAADYAVEVSNAGARVTSETVPLGISVTLRTTALGRGVIAVDPIQDIHPLGALATLVAIPDDDAFFSGWSGDLEGDENPAPIVLEGNRAVTAVFGSRRLDLAVVGQGSIDASPLRTFYTPGEQVQLSAAAAGFYQFVGWQDGPTEPHRQITIGVSNRYVAIFTNLVPVETVVIGDRSRTAPVGMPALTVDGEFIVIGPEVRSDSAEIRLTTTLTNGTLVYSLDGSSPNLFYDGPVNIRNSVIVRALAISEDQMLIVELDPIEVRVLRTFQLTAVTPGGGQLERAPMKSRYLSNEVVKVTALASNGWSFIGWHGDVSGTSQVISITMDGDRCLEGVFGTPVSAGTTGAGVVETEAGLALYPYGARFRVTAIAAAGSNFVSWSGAIANAVNPLDFQVTSPSPVLRALFLSSGNGFPLEVQVAGEGSVIVFPRKTVYTSGEAVLVLASAKPGERFLGWSGDINQTTNRLNLKIIAPLKLRAEFSQSARIDWLSCSDDIAWENLRLSVFCRLGSEVQVERSEDLNRWEPWLLQTNTLGSLLMQDSSRRPTAGRFYRLRTPQGR